ncbi:MAG: PilC/PilY family type IV pilus protein [Pseudomonadota bacterium]
MSHYSFRPHAGRLKKVAAAIALIFPAATGWTADIDIYGPSPAAGSGPNVVFLLDNTSNWSGNNQNWNAHDSWAKCSSLGISDPARLACQNLIDTIYYAGTTGKYRPWDTANYAKNKDNIELTQGQVQLRAMKLVLNALVCSGTSAALKINMGVSMIGDTGSTLNNGHATGFMRFAVQPLVGTATTAGSSCKALIDDLDNIDSKITNPTFKAPSNANYGAPLYEIFKYFGGHTNPTLASTPAPNGGSPIGATGYGPIRFSNVNTLDDVNAFTSAAKTTYRSPITAANSCGNNYVVLVGNTYPNAEANNGGPTIFGTSNLNYTPPTLSALTSDTSRYADEWTYFLANTDVSSEAGVQRVMTYTVNTYKDKPSPDQAKLLKSMAAVGGIGPSAYLEVGGDLVGLVDAFKDIFLNIASVDSVFSATTLPVSTTTQGTFLNQIFVGMFRPDGNASPRWVGNLKQYQFGMVEGVLDLVGKDDKSAVGAGFFTSTAKSFWTEDSVFFAAMPSGTPLSASDFPDGSIVEKGGAAQQLRKKYLQGASTRNVQMLSGTSLVPFDTTSGFTAAEVSWIKGENNVTAGDGMEQFNGSYSLSGVTTALGSTGARHSIHGDVLHSRPVALNYGDGDVMVYYGANDGFLRAVNGNKTGTTAGQEIWSFIPPESYPLITRLRNANSLLHLPETDSSGATVPVPTVVSPAVAKAPKSYGMDGPIGVYARYAAGGSSITEAIIYPTMRRGGRSVYAFDVKSKTTPLLKWRIQGGTGSYVKLAQTWSMPKPVVFNSSEAKAPIVIMGAGYDPLEDTNSSSATDDGSGKAIYIINGLTGARIAELVTEYSVPSDVTVVDVTGDGQPDRAYVADVRGNLYRIDFPTGDKTLSTTWTGVAAKKIASLGGKVFFPPDVVVTKNFVAVLVGTGDREKPLLNSSTDKFVLIRDTLGAPATGHFTIADLALVASVNNSDMSLVPPSSTIAPTNGCYINLATNGEKSINAPFTIAGATYFGTNRPKPAGSATCSADLGEAYAYKFPLFCSVPDKPTLVTGGGMLPSPVGGIVTVNVNGVDVKVPFLIGSGKDNSAFKPDEPKPPVPPIRTRQTWRIDNSNR